MTGTVTDGPLTAERKRLRPLLAQIDLDEQVRRRSVQQAILKAEAWWWAWQAEQFHAAAPKRDDYHGRATSKELTEAIERCRGIALSCCRKAAFLDWEAGLRLFDPGGEPECPERPRGVARPELVVLAGHAEEADDDD